jgi:hypothetical protein
MASISSIEKILGSPVLHLQVWLCGTAVIVTDQIYSDRVPNALVRPQSRVVDLKNN